MTKNETIKKHNPLVLFCCTAISIGWPAAVLAQESTSEVTTLDEVIVTARLVEESLQDVPMSIAAFDEQMIDERGLEDLTEIARSTPGFAFENFNGAFATPVIRGQSQNRLTNPVQNVATFYNGIYLQRGYMVDSSLLNVGQIEVLRGPQAAAFGRNAYAGAVNFRTKAVGDQFQGAAVVEFGEDDYQRIDLTTQIPFGDYGGLSLGYSTSEYDGAWENNHALANTSDPLARTTGNLGGFDSDAFQIGFDLNVTDNLTVKLNLLDSERDVENVAQYTVSGSGLFDVNPLNCSGTGFLGANALFCGELPVDPILVDGNARKSGLVIDPRTGISLESQVLSFDVNYDLSESMAINFLYGKIEGAFEGAGSSVYDQEVGYTGPFAGPPIFLDRLLIDTSGNGNIESDSYEMRFTWKGENTTAYLGGYYSDGDDATEFALLSVPAQTTGPLDPGFELNFPGFAANSLDSRNIKSLFGFWDYRSGRWAYSVEGRLTRESIIETNFVSATGAKEEFDYFTPRLAATYFVSDNRSYYGSIAGGVKAGGFNVGGSDPSSFDDPSQSTFDEETNTTIEFGSRNVLMDGALTLNATVYFIKAKDLQVSVPRLGQTGTVVANRAEADTTGLEVELSYDVSDSLQLYGGLSLNNAEYGDVIDVSNASRCDDIVCSSTGDVSGNDIERAPKVMLNAGLNYDGSINTSMDYYLRGNVGYQSSQYVSAINVTEIEARTITDVSAGLYWNNFEARLAVDNLFDEEYVSSAFQIGFLSAYTPNLGNRRRASVRLSYRFD
ncbi:MAG: TonB-dependent receptor [Woeseiaceae bacterium]